MPGPKALPIELTDAEREHLGKMVRKRTAPDRQVRRSQIVLLAADGMANRAPIGLFALYCLAVA